VPGSHITSQDVRQAAEVTSGRDLRWFFQQWVTERVWLDYAVGRVETAPHTDAQGRTGYRNRWKYAASGGGDAAYRQVDR